MRDKICKYCGKVKTISHHCSGSKAYDKGRKESIQLVINRTAKRLCLFCETNLDLDIGEGKWHIPLCKKHREIELKSVFGGEKNENL